MKFFKILIWWSLMCVNFACMRDTFTTTVLPSEQGKSLQFGYIQDIKACPDGGYALLGSGKYENNQKVFLMKFNQKGELNWTKLYDGEFEEVAVFKKDFYYGYGVNHLSVDEANNILFPMVTEKFRNGKFINRYLTLLKTSPTGKIIWAKEMGGEDDRITVYDIQYLNNKSYMITGQSMINGATPKIFIIHISNGGEIIWGKTYHHLYPPSHFDNHGLSIVQLDNGELILLARITEEIGWSGVPIRGLKTLYFRIDAQGVPLQVERFSLNKREVEPPHTLLKISNNKLLMVGQDYLIQTDNTFSYQNIYQLTSAKVQIEYARRVNEKKWVGSGYLISREVGNGGIILQADTNTQQIEWVYKEENDYSEGAYFGIFHQQKYIVGTKYVFPKSSGGRYILPALFSFKNISKSKKSKMKKIPTKEISFQKVDSLHTHTVIPIDRIQVEDIPLSFEDIDIESYTIDLKTTNTCMN
ncbi:MAG: hypothetical protein R3E32_14265 [Chitinophagales bacterium]